MTEQCVFCQIAEDDTSKRIILENDLALVMRDGFPISPGHSLIVPKHHIASFFETSKEERDALLDLIEKAKSTIEQEFSPDAFNIGINDGPAAGQTVSHLHIHLIPRYQDDVSDPRGGVRWVIPDKADYWSQPDD